MRTTRTLLLSLAGLALAANLASAQRPAPKVKPLLAVIPPPDRVLLQKEVEGRGETEEEAKRDAAEQARATVEQFLRSQKPPLTWSPPASYIGEHLLGGEPRRGEDVVIRTPAGRTFTVQCWNWPLVVTAEHLRRMTAEAQAQRAREQYAERVVRSAERMVGLTKVLAGLVVVLVGVVGYLKLDDWTKGYYTGWLQAGLAGLLIATGLGLWLWS